MYRFFNGSFYAYSLRERYEASGTWPDGGVDVDDDAYKSLISPPAGKQIGSDADGNPVWVDIPQYAEQKIAAALSALAAEYKADMYDLNQAYLAAIVADGPVEVAKQTVVRSRIADRKSKYAADVAAARQ